ncbi:hypothetical protein THASP1DRAFT_32931 [Thamnocephalis sphaerospora]|uniref:F-box domain-containing protein n=1 Tax=Thamnocephalis sphaerospora TaxID=78915 RepID=A0A4P9XJ58_9FUNG|nr:hypothetical protein THASP1DRAFT_32931 [Thamnocephalis sphaerospora]|eukprot:RKP05230.1 hypothetical protein THASP1DRAFT_32931 [Thamnocephalis sphaerospora]
MNRVPAEIVYRIVYVSDDEEALVALAATSRWLHACVAAQRKLWRRRFERDFPRQDENELRWLQLYARTHLADRLFAEKQQEVLLPTDELLDWFHAYCSRRATEYRWRHGLYTVQQAKQVAGICVGGIRLQSIIITSRATRDMRVLSQRILAPQQRPIWITEQLCWDGVDAENMLVTEERYSDEYLVIAVEARSMAMSVGSTNASLYVWHLNALHLPPRLIMRRFMGSISLYKNWLVVRKHFMSGGAPSITLVFDLAKNTARPGIIEGGASKLHIQQVTKDNVRLLWRDKIKAKESHAMVSWRLWDFTPDRAPPTHCPTIYKAQFYANDSRLETCRVDDSRFAMFSRTSWNRSADTTLPTIALMEIMESDTGTTIKEKWSTAQELTSIEPIVSRDMLLVTLPSEKYMLLNLSDGSPIHDISIATLDCWSGNGLYPLRSQWTNMAEKITLERLKGDPDLASIGVKTFSASSNAMLIFVDDIPAAADFSL